MRAIAAWCVHHRRLVITAWLLALAASSLLAHAVGTSYANSLSLPHTDSARATALLRAASPTVSGDSEQVAIEAPADSTVTSPPVREAVSAMLARVARVPHVTRVLSPYRPGAASQISRDRRVAFALITFDLPFEKISPVTARQLVRTVQSADRGGVQAAVTGQVAESTVRPIPATAGAGILAAAVVLALAFGSLFATLLPLVSALASLGTAVAVIGLLTHVMNIAQNSAQFVLLLGLGVGVDYALFIVTRHRQGLLAGRDIGSSILSAVETSGRAVMFAGVTVCISVLALFALGVSFFYGLAVATALGVALTMLAALTLLPAMLGFIGPKVLSRRERARGMTGARLSAFWTRWSGLLARRPALLAVSSLIVIAVIAVPSFALHLGSSDQGNDPPGSTTRQAYDMLSRGFGPGFNAPLELVSAVRGPAQQAAFSRVIATVRREPGVAAVTSAQVIPISNGSRVSLAIAYPSTSPQAAATTELIHRLRSTTVPAATTGSDLRVYIGGTTAIFTDFDHALSAKLPFFIAVIIGVSVLILALVLRSLVIPLMAAVMNILAIGATFGVLVAVFQFGWLSAVFGTDHTAGPIEAFMPAFLFPVLFGLSMDYQVFLLTRFHEEWLRTGDNRPAVREGLAATGRTITAAALIMILVFGAFTIGSDRVIKEFGLGLAAGVLIDAVVIRSALVPSLMFLVGRANWWFPDWLGRILPTVAVEGSVSSGSRHSRRDTHRLEV